MYDISDEDFKNLNKEYKEEKVNIAVELHLARRFLIDNNDLITIISQIIISVSLFAFLVLGICFYGLKGILYSGFADLLFLSYMGICSMGNSMKTSLLYIFIFALLLPFAFGWAINIFVVCILINLIFIYWFYFYIGYKVVHKFALKNKYNLIFLIENSIIVIM